MTNAEIINLYEGLYELSQDKDKTFSIKVGYIFAKDKNLLQPYYEAAINSRLKLLKKYGTELESGDIQIPGEQVLPFRQEHESFLNMENYIVLDKISLKDVQDEKLNIDIMEKLLPIIEKDAE